MLGQKSSYFACGQILYCLKMSNLNYLVKETPYSAYIMTRKKFVRGNVENLNNLLNDPCSKDLKVEVNALRESNKDLETRLALAKVDFEERELEKDTLLVKLQKQDEEIEYFVRKERMLNEEIKVLNREKEGLQTNIDHTLNEKRKHIIDEKDYQNSTIKKNWKQ